MSRKRWLTTAGLAFIAAIAALLPAPPLHAGDDPYRLLAGRAPALADVRFVLKIKLEGGGADREIEGETTCPLIDDRGLVLCSNTELGGYVNLMSQMMGGARGFNVSAAPREIRVVIGEHEGKSARLLARDTDRDLAWVQVDDFAGTEDVAFLDFADSAELGPGDKFYRLRRMDRFFGAAPVVTEGIVAAVISKPRRLLVPSVPMSGGFGLPMFTADGRLVGISVIQMPAAEDQAGGFSGGMSFLGSAAKFQDMVGGLILPAAEVVKATRLAREVFPEDEEDE